MASRRACFGGRESRTWLYGDTHSDRIDELDELGIDAAQAQEAAQDFYGLTSPPARVGHRAADRAPTAVSCSDVSASPPRSR
ncbi:hypothetical protein L1887_47073 [Cichorium endivia]|nr:hypothetical protein L1887_47073 [Cichorium endivia]